MNAHNEYIENEFKKIVMENPEHLSAIKVFNSAGQTNWIAVTNEQLQQIKKLLLESETI